jgi:hypothetical protein
MNLIAALGDGPLFIEIFNWLEPKCSTDCFLSGYLFQPHIGLNLSTLLLLKIFGNLFYDRFSKIYKIREGHVCVVCKLQHDDVRNLYYFGSDKWFTTEWFTGVWNSYDNTSIVSKHNKLCPLETTECPKNVYIIWIIITHV